MNGPGLIVAAVSYGALLFLLAWRVERAPERAARWRRWAYPFALAVYCTSWTFYGAVGSAYDQGWSYLPIYLGPVLVYALGTPFLARLVTETRLEGATTVSDFIGARHNRSPMVAALVSLIALIGIVPYLALQLRSIGTSYARIAGVADPLLVPAASGALLAVFALLFGTRRFDRASRNDGLLVAVAVESVVKLIAFAAVGVFAVALLFGASDAAATAGRAALAQRFDPAAIDADFFVVTLLSAAAILCLPRQFDRVPGGERADAGDDGGPVPHGRDDGVEDRALLFVGGGRRLARGAVDDQALVAQVVDQVRGQPRDLRVVDLRPI